MKTSTRRALTLMASTLLTALDAAAASIASSAVDIDWTSLAVTSVAAGGDAAPALIWISRTSTVNAYTPEAKTASDWTSALNASVGDSASFAESSVTASGLHTSAEDTDPRPDSSGSIWTLREGQLTVAGSGTLRFSVDYIWQASLLPEGSPSFSGFSYAFISLGAETRYEPHAGDNRSDYAEVNIQLVSSSPSDTGSFQGNGTLEINVPVRDGDYFYFTARSGSTANISAVPAPPTAWLWGAGLLGLAGLARSRP